MEVKVNDIIYIEVYDNYTDDFMYTKSKVYVVNETYAFTRYDNGTIYKIEKTKLVKRDDKIIAPINGRRIVIDCEVN